MGNVQINYKDIIANICEQFSDFVSFLSSTTDPFYADVYDLVKGFQIEVSDEQNFVKYNAIDNNKVYIVVKFGSASVNFGSSVCNLNLVIFGTENRVKPTQMFLSAFCSKYNLTTLKNNEEITQIWASPTVTSTFTPTGNAFRNLFNMPGTLVIGQSVTKIGEILYSWSYGTTSGTETVDVLAFSEGYQASMSPQPFGNTHGFTKSEANFSTATFNVSTYLLDNHLVADCMHARGLQKISNAAISSDKGPNDYFEFKINFTNGYANFDPLETNNSDKFFQKYKLVSYTITTRIGEIPTFSATFTY